jgi:hypothetical protein
MLELCLRCHNLRFICEEHHWLPWPHEDCRGPGVPCPHCNRGQRPRLPVGFHSRASTAPILNAGDEIKCEHCRGWHVLKHRHQPGEDASHGGPSAFLFIVCRGRRYFVGSAGTTTDRQVRPPSKR